MSVLSHTYQIVLPVVFNTSFHSSLRIISSIICPGCASYAKTVPCSCCAASGSLEEICLSVKDTLKVLIQPWGHKDNTIVIGSS